MLVYPDGNVHGANMGPTCVLSAPVGFYFSPTNLAIRILKLCILNIKYYIYKQRLFHNNTMPWREIIDIRLYRLKIEKICLIGDQRACHDKSISLNNTLCICQVIPHIFLYRPIEGNVINHKSFLEIDACLFTYIFQLTCVFFITRDHTCACIYECLWYHILRWLK